MIVVKKCVKQTNEVDVDGLPKETFIDDNQSDDEHSVTSSKIKKRSKARIIRSVWFNKEAEPEKHYHTELREKVLKQIPSDPRKTKQLHSILKLAVGERIIWVQFDHAEVGQKTRHDNSQLYVEGIEPTWTPIKPVNTQFAVGRNRSVEVVRKQFPLRPAAAKTIHRSQGDNETRNVVNFNTRRAIPHIHYVGLRVTTLDGLFIIILSGLTLRI